MNKKVTSMFVAMVAFTLLSSLVGGPNRGSCTCDLEPSGVLRSDNITPQDCYRKNGDSSYDVAEGTITVSGCSFKYY